VNRIRTRLIAVFLAATIVPLIVTGVLMSSLLEQSLSYTTTGELNRLSQSLEETGRDYYVQARETLRKEAKTGTLQPRSFGAAARDAWPPAVGEFWDSGEPERFVLSGEGGDRIEYMLRGPAGVQVFERSLGNVHMEDLRAQIRDTRELVEQADQLDLRRGLTTVLMMLIAAVWIVSFGFLIFIANRMSRPIQQLTAGLSELAAGNLAVRLDARGSDEIARAVGAFNSTAGQLQRDREKLVYLTQVASWQMLARKMAHELKNALTPIRLTVEEIRARPHHEPRFMDDAVRIVVSEVESLERRVRAFSEFASEPEVRMSPLDLNAIAEERVALLRSGHPAVRYTLELAADLPQVVADADRIKGILTNLLENAAQAAAGGQVLVRSYRQEDLVHVEVHDSGPGLSAEAQATLFEPTISFKEGGMGLGLSIARKDALLCAGDLMAIDGRLGGAGFRLALPLPTGEGGATAQRAGATG
jgi:nitrogen fixation/metabolism regulation signal transduction histidine kinase